MTFHFSFAIFNKLSNLKYLVTNYDILEFIYFNLYMMIKIKFSVKKLGNWMLGSSKFCLSGVKKYQKYNFMIFYRHLIV